MEAIQTFTRPLPFFKAQSVIKAITSKNVSVTSITAANKVKSVLEDKREITTVTLPPFKKGRYFVDKSITSSIEIISKKEIIATFEEAGITISAASIPEALHMMKIEIIELYEIYKSHPRLGPEPKRQLAILEKYIGERTA